MPCASSTVVIGHGGPIDIPRLEAILAKWAKSTAVDLHIQCHDASQPDFVTHDDSKKNRLEHLAKLLIFRSQIKIFNKSKISAKILKALLVRLVDGEEKHPDKAPTTQSIGSTIEGLPKSKGAAVQSSAFDV
ncbi:hypothetical protein M422DRAFT_270705 [Sphaerobolus stellatus SS14]|uniref:Uncharacterized protein n=1 Tax=Sphaerobolus stellatus (strain SS14) TaxID=990650 RepID=A0A0C9US79_SPHS4|nr:hypothetical protein M422DRAFT_270705 [Sphaerobolus stellatus SS14]